MRSRDAASFARLAWHPAIATCRAQIEGERILIRDDHVIVDMLKGLGAEVRKVKAPFDPEAAPTASTITIPATITVHCAANAMTGPLYRLLAAVRRPSDRRLQLQPRIETAVEEGIKDRASLVAWLETVLRDGTGRVDGALFAAAWRAADAADWLTFDDVAERATAWRGTSEMALESRQQGGSFLSITRTAWPHAALVGAHDRLGGELALPVAVALAAAAHDITLETALGAYLHAFTANLISAAVRTVPLGQSDGQLALAALEGYVSATARAAIAVESLDEVGTATPLIDWCSLRHATQYPRLFRS